MGLHALHRLGLSEHKSMAPLRGFGSTVTSLRTICPTANPEQILGTIYIYIHIYIYIYLYLSICYYMRLYYAKVSHSPETPVPQP